MPFLVGWDVVGIQDFVYGSNRLRDVVGASLLVDDACRLLRGGASLSATGGVSIRVYDAESEAREAIARASRHLLVDAPGLDVAVATLEFEPGSLARTFSGLGRALEVAKLSRRFSAPLGGLGVTVSCTATGRPATDVHADGSGSPTPVSASISRARERFYTKDSNSFLDGCEGLVFPVELDDLGGTKGERSMLAIVHLDGDGIGIKIDEWRQQQAQAGTSDDDFIADIQGWSKDLESAGKATFRAVVRRVVRRLEGDRIGSVDDPVGFELGVDRSGGGTKGKLNLPLRLILLGGDDLTFVCDGRLGLELARVACEAFELHTSEHRLGPLTASAGVALVPSHTPFVRAYAIAEQMCRSAKRTRRELAWQHGAVDWHLGAELPQADIDKIRDNDLANQPGTPGTRLTLRPYPVNSVDRPTTLGWLLDDLLGMGDDGLRGGRWSRARSKVRSLADQVAFGADLLRPVLDAWRIVEPELGFPRPLNDVGFEGSATPLVDANELLDRTLWPIGGSS